ncbi:unnamed protein product [Parajaminaea phylloscopi]
MEALTVPHLLSSHNTIHLSVFHSVSNVKSLLSSLRAGAPDDTLPSNITSEVLSQYAFLDASVIVSRQHVLNAVLEALARMETGNMKTKAWSTEVMWILWPGGNISDSLKHIGLGPTASSLVVIRIGASDGSHAVEGTKILGEMMSLVRGSLDLRGLAAFEDTTEPTERITDWTKVAQMHKLPTLAGDITGEDRERIRSVVESATAIKNVAA